MAGDLTIDNAHLSTGNASRTGIDSSHTQRKSP